VLTDHDYPDRRRFLIDESSGFQPIHAGHSNIHQYEIRFVLFCLTNAINSVHGFANDLDVRFQMEHFANTATDYLTIIHDEHTKDGCIH